jgi:phosphomannomutase/phosphoglucomutase
MWKTGHSYIKAKLQEEGAALAGEMSGHIFFADGYYGFDDAFFAGLKMLEYISQEHTSVSALVDSTPYYLSTPTIQVDTTDEEKYAIAEALTKEFQKEGYRVVTLSGARVYIEDGWGLVRASSNTPTLVMRFEAKTKEGLEKIQNIFKEKLSRIPGISKDWNTSGH